jgi:rhamnosyl/mannosyltransferase
VYVHHFDIELRFLGVPSLLYNVVNHRLCANADRVVTSSHSYAHVLRHRVGERVHVIPWGVDPVLDPITRSNYDGSRPLGVLFVGQQRDYKGVSNLIHAIAGEPALRLTVVGDGPLLERHVRLVEQLGCTNVDVVGPVDDDELRRHYLDHEVIALPSVTKVEAFGVVLLEGMQMGCVPIASDLAGVRDVVGGDGILTPPRRIVSLRDELRRLAAHPHEVRTRSVAASERAAHFTWMRTGELYAALVAELTGAGS